MQPVSQVLLKISKALQDSLITDSGLKLYLDPTYDKSFNCAVTATIAALPQNVHPKHKKILNQLKVGDEVCISYQVVASFEFKNDDDNFMKVTDENDYVKEFVNAKGEWIKCYALPKFKGISKIQWVGVYQDKSRKVISGVQGTERELERWMAQFSFGKTDIYTHDNFFEYNKNEYWKCNIEDIFAKRVDGHLVAVGNRVIMKPIEEDVPEDVKNSLGYGNDVKIRHQDRGRVITGGKEKGIKKEQVVSFNPRHLEKYEFYGKEYFMVNQNLIQGIWN